LETIIFERNGRNGYKKHTETIYTEILLSKSVYSVAKEPNPLSEYAATSIPDP